MTHTAKILVKVICKRMENKIKEKLGYDQYGFRKNKGTREAILGLRILMEKQLELDKNMLIAFVDLEKAFDKVSWQKLFQTLQQVGVDYKDRQLIYKYYRYQTAELSIEANLQQQKYGKVLDKGAPCHQCCLMYMSNNQSKK